MALLEVENLRIVYPLAGTRHRVPAVEGVSLDVGAGESVGLVGESGCGKTSVANAVVRLVRPESGCIRFKGQDVAALRGQACVDFRRAVQMVFQDPFGSLNPRMTIGSALGEVLSVHGLAATRDARRRRVGELLEQVGLSSSHAEHYPHEFSGGQRQRVGIARALAVDPALIVADEPVSALDVSVQVQILNLMRDLQRRMGLAYLFIAHDLGVVRYVCDRILVMYMGRIVETGPADAVLAAPAHPYTEALISAVPDIDSGLAGRAGGRRRIVLRGEVPSHATPVSGCPFHPRCHRCREVCRSVVPPRQQVGANRTSVCHFALETMRGALPT